MMKPALLLTFTVAAAADARPVLTDRVMSVELAPAAPGADGRIAGLVATIHEPVGEVAAGAPLLRLPRVISNVETSAVSLQNLTAEDARGPVVLTVRDDAPGPRSYRRWTAGRAVAGPLVVRYRVPITDAPNLRGAAV